MKRFLFLASALSLLLLFFNWSQSRCGNDLATPRPDLARSAERLGDNTADRIEPPNTSLDCTWILGGCITAGLLDWACLDGDDAILLADSLSLDLAIPDLHLLPGTNEQSASPLLDEEHTCIALHHSHDIHQFRLCKRAAPETDPNLLGLRWPSSPSPLYLGLSLLAAA